MPNHSITTTNPSTGGKISSYEIHTASQVDSILHRAQAAQIVWRSKPIADRAEVLRKLGSLLLAQKSSLAKLMNEEMGKSIGEAEAEVEKCANCASYYAESGPKFLQSKQIESSAKNSFVAFEPLGVVLAIMPWNFPLWQALRCAIPALLAGNVVVLKHASNVTGSALAAEKLVKDAAGVSGLLQALILPGADAEKLIGKPEISAVSFTGSTDVGRKIASAAGQNLKKCVLELGGSDAYVILADADLTLAANICAKSRLLNSGQSCISAKRFIVEKAVSEEFEQKFLAELQKIAIAPLARADLRQELHDQVQRSISAGAKLLCGGKIPEGPGNFYPATLLSGVEPGMAVFQEETFGPVAALVVVENEEMAIRLANQSEFGLGAAVFTMDANKGQKIAEKELFAGSCFVNELVRSDSRLPFGGIKNSGYGRELGEFGVHEFVNIKTVYVGG